MAGKTIPIRNIYYLLLYAWEQWSEGTSLDVDAIDSPGLVDLLAGILVQGTKKILRRGLDRGYRGSEEETSRIRGRLDFAETSRRMLLRRAQVYCRYDELSPDTLANQILKSTLLRLQLVHELDNKWRQELEHLRRRLAGVDEINVSRSHFRRVQLYGNNAFHRFLLNVCQLVHENLLPTEVAGRLRFRDFRRDDIQMWRLFETFAFKFYRREQSVFRVTRQAQIAWDATFEDVASEKLLPGMNADILLESRDRVLLIDTKFYRESLQAGQYRSTFHSANLYQIFAYLKNAERRGGAFSWAEGMLLYPTVRHELDHRLELQGHPVRLRTIDLTRDWKGIHEDLLSAIADPGIHPSGRSNHVHWLRPVSDVKLLE